MGGLKKDAAFRLEGLETKEQFLAQNTRKLQRRSSHFTCLANTINMQQEANTNSELGVSFVEKKKKILFEQMLMSFQLRFPQQPRSGVRAAFV